MAFLSFRGIGKGHFQGTGTGVQGLADAVVRGIGFAFIASGIGFALRFIGKALA